MAGIALFALASLAGGFATDQAWLLTARAIQGIGGALAAPASLSLIAVTFPEGRERNRAMGVYSAVSIAGAAIGLIAPRGGHLSAAAQTALGNHALAYGFGRGYLVAAGIAVLAVIIALVMIRVKRSDLEGIDPMAAQTG